MAARFVYVLGLVALMSVAAFAAQEEVTPTKPPKTTAAVPPTTGLTPPLCPNGCSGNGDCLGQRCQCYMGWAGLDCSIHIGCLHDCFGHGECRSGVCFCKRGWEGEDCGLRSNTTIGIPVDQRNLTEQIASEQVAKFLEKYQDKTDPSQYEIAAWVKAFMTQKLRDLSELEAAIKADQAAPTLSCPNNCSMKGQCIEGDCVCYDGWEGVDCSMKSCLNNCSFHGRCDNGMCRCEDGYSGADCSISFCPNDCSGHGSCNQGTGKCTCNQGWQGEACNVVTNDGSTPNRAGESCSSLAYALGDPTGLRWINPGGRGALQVWCQGEYTVCASFGDYKKRDGLSYTSNKWATDGYNFVERAGHGVRPRSYGNFCPDVAFDKMYAEVRGPVKGDPGHLFLRTSVVTTNGQNPFNMAGFSRFEESGSVIAFVNRKRLGDYGTDYFVNAQCAKIRNKYNQGTDICVSDGRNWQTMMGYINAGLYGAKSQADWLCKLNEACGHESNNAIIFYVK